MNSALSDEVKISAIKTCYDHQTEMFRRKGCRTEPFQTADIRVRGAFQKNLSIEELEYS
jgi:uncharacterized protein YecT (DUF1311 family)